MGKLNITQEQIVSRGTELVEGKMYIEGDLKISKTLIHHKDICAQAREAFRFSIFDNVIKDGNVVFDVGAYIGDTTSYFLEKGCEVFAFEPSPVPFKCLQYNCGDNPKAKLFNLALGSKSHKELFFYSCDGGYKNPAGQMFSHKGGNGKVKCGCLDQFTHLEKCDFLKLDAQAFEPHIIDGGKQFLLKYKPVIYVEIWEWGLVMEGFDPEIIDEKLFNLGYVKELSTKRDAVFMVK